MLAVVKEGPGPGFALRDLPIPKLLPGTVLVRVGSVGICGSDIPIFNGIRKVPYPLVPGHEFAGEIADIADDVSGWEIGERVAVGLVIGCGHCPMCRRGDENLCAELREIGIHINGAYAEYVRVPIRCLHRIPDSMSYADGATVDPLASAYRGIRRMSPQPSDQVVIFGPGPIGLYALQAVRVSGVTSVTVVGQHPGPRMDAAHSLGADLVVNSARKDLTSAIANITGGSMASLVVEATGKPNVFEQLLSICAKDARVLILGIFHEDACFTPATLVRGELRVEGSFCYNWIDFEMSLDLIKRGLVSNRHLITHTLPLDQIGQALEIINCQEAIKVILQPTMSA